MSDCWMWDASRNAKGYGKFRRRDGVGQMAHRLVYEALVGQIPRGLTLDHACENPGCVNPAHLTPMSSLANYQKGPWTSPNRTHCPQGHEYTPENTKRIPSKPNYRYCRACHKLTSHAARDRRLRQKQAG